MASVLARKNKIAVALTLILFGSPSYASDYQTESSALLTRSIQSDDIEEDVEEEIENDVEEEVESEIEEDIEADVEQDIENDIEQDVESDIEQDIESDIEQDIESDIEQDIESDIEQDIESDIEQDIEGDIEDDIEGDIEDDIESDIEDDIEGDIEDDIESDIEDDIESDIEDGIEGDIEDDIEGDIEDDIEGDIEDDIEGDIEDDIESDIEDDIEGDIEDDIEGDIEGDIEEDVEDELEDNFEVEDFEELDDDSSFSDDDFSSLLLTQGGALESLVKSQVEDVYQVNLQNQIYRLYTDNWLILSHPDDRDRLKGSGVEIVSESPLSTLSRSLFRVRAPKSFEKDINANLALLSELKSMDRSIDFNHIYDTASKSTLSADSKLSPVDLLSVTSSGKGVRIGMVDTAIDLHHPSIQRARIHQASFAEKPSDSQDYHGTAVAAKLVGNTENYLGLLPDAELLAASIFFNQPQVGSIATTESLVLALDWLVANQIKVINLSLTGPPNQILRTAIKQYCADGVVIVAAVGNHGPNAAPMYPAAYDCVIGVTAVNKQYRIYRRAIRGSHVDVAAPGVLLRAPSTDSGYADVTGTSFAAPYVTAFIASKMHIYGSENLWYGSVLPRLIDLGDKGKDPIYGYGVLPFELKQ